MNDDPASAAEGSGLRADESLDLRTHFPLPTLADWRAKVESELRGKRYSRLVHETDDRVKIPPILTDGVLEGMPHFRVPVAYPRGWRACRRLVAEEPAAGNAAVRAALEEGVDIVRVLPRFSPTEDSIRRLADGLPSDRVFLDAGVRGDPRQFGWTSLQVVTVERSTRRVEPGSPAEQLAHAILDLVAALRDRYPDESVDDVAGRLPLAMPVSTEILQEIAKLRAARLLWRKIVDAFGGDSTLDSDDPERPRGARVYARTSRFSWTRYDPHSNLLRHAVAAFAAATGGADYVEIAPFDGEGAPAGAASWRLALNQSRLLAEEAHIGAVADPFAGSYVIEHLTHAIAKRAWKMIQRVDAGQTASRGVGDPLLREEHIPIADTLVARQRRIRHRKSKLVGVTAFADPAQEAHVADVPARLDAPTRLASPFEALRDATRAHAERTGRRARALLVPVGPLGERRSRADFAADLFRTAGLDVIDPGKIADLDEALALVESQAPIAVVLCGDHDSYAELAPAMAACCIGSDPQPSVYVVGREPTELQMDATIPVSMRAAMAESNLPWGVHGFLHPDIDAVEVLSELLERRGISA